MGDYEDGDESPSDQGSRSQNSHVISDEESADNIRFPFAAINSDSESFHSQFSLTKMQNLLSKLTGPQKKIVRKCGFGSLLYLKCTQYSKDLVVSLAKKYDVGSRSVKFDDSNYFVLDAFTVHQILGTPYGGIPVARNRNPRAKEVIARDTGQSSIGAKIDDLINLVDKELDGDRFARVFMLIVLSIFLCPTSNSRISPQFNCALLYVKDIAKYDWSSAICEFVHLKLKSFQSSLLKGNSSGQSSLGGCIFILLAAYFDYLQLPERYVSDLVPRVRVWDDTAIRSYEAAEMSTEHIQVRPIDDTLFHKKHANPSNYRGFKHHVGAASTVKSVTNTPCQDTTAKSFREPSHANSHNEQPNVYSPFNEQSVVKILDKSSNLSLKVLCGEELHPDVDNFINSNISGQDNEKIRAQIKDICLSFYKDSVQRYILAVEPVLVKQSCDIVSSYSNGLQQSTGASVIPPTNPMQSRVDAYARSVYNQGEQALGCSKIANKQGYSGESKLLDGNVSSLLDLSDINLDDKDGANTAVKIVDKPSKDDDWQEKSPQVVDATSSFFGVKQPFSVQTPPKTQHASTYSVDVNLHEKNGANTSSKVGDNPSNDDDRQEKSRPVVDGASSFFGAHTTFSVQTPQKRHHASSYQSPSKLVASPEKKMKSSSLGTLEGDANVNLATKFADVKACSTSDPFESQAGDTGDATHKDAVSDSAVGVVVQGGKKQTKLSSMLQKKRPQRLPAALATPTMVLTMHKKKMQVKQLEKDIFHIATKRVKKDDSPVVAKIGRFWISHADFGNAMRPKKWVGSFMMDVYCEALNYDERHAVNSKLKKCFLTSDIVHKLKVKDISLDDLKSKLDPATVGFSLNQFDMIMIPICEDLHWWLVVANMRDNRFDILNSMKPKDKELSLSKIICTNFERVYQEMYGHDSNVDFTKFELKTQMVPQQTTACDCGIFVMEFLPGYSGRKVPHIDNDQILSNRQKLASYVICHEANVETLPEIKEILAKQQGIHKMDSGGASEQGGKPPRIGMGSTLPFPAPVSCSKGYEKGFTTKLSLRKFISVARSLTPIQRELVDSMGFLHVLDVCCDTLPRGIILWLVKYFDAKTRTVHLPNGFSFTISSMFIHQMLGIPIGGKSIPITCEESVRKLIAEETKCADSFPTINELKNLFTEQLEGDKFKRIFMMFTLSTLLCPTSYDHVSPEYFSAIWKPEEISMYDWSGVVLDKIASSIFKYQQSGSSCGTSALGGCVFVLAVIYFELLDQSDIKFPDSVPRIRFWSTEVVKMVEEADATFDDRTSFGRLPMRDISLTPFRRRNLTETCIDYYQKDLSKELLSTLPGQEFSEVRIQLQKRYEEMCIQCLRAMQLIFFEQVIQTAITISQNHRRALSAASSSVEKKASHLSNESMGPPKVSSNNDNACKVSLNNATASAALGNKLESVDLSLAGFPTFIIDDIEQSKFSIGPILDELVSMYEASVKDIPPGLDIYPAPQQLIEDVERSLFPYPLDCPVDRVADNLSTMSVYEVAMLNDDKNSADYSNTDAPRLEKRMNHRDFFGIHTLHSSSVRDLQSVAVPYKKRHLLTGADTESGLQHITQGFSINNSTNSSSIIPVARSLDDLLQYHSAARKKQKSQSETAMVQPSAPQQQSLHTLYVNSNITPEAPMVDCAQQAQSNCQPTVFDAFEEWDADILHQVGQSMTMIENMYTPVSKNENETCNQSSGQQSNSARRIQISIPLEPKLFYHVFTSTILEREVYQYIVGHIPPLAPAPSRRILKFNNKWVDHRTFGLSMQVFGSVSMHVINAMSEAVMMDQYKSQERGLLPPDSWTRYIVRVDTAELFQNPDLVPTDISHLFTEKRHGFKLDTMDMICLPLKSSRFWYLIVANFKHNRFEVFCPNEQVDNLKSEAEIEDAKPLRESLTYYLVANKYNSNLSWLPEVQTILANHVRPKFKALC
ncbi:hypothetical protein EJB05_23742 [Eragrostis curvula]|uniref:Ubiquitin-like protease family profile domain-containing protein n=1 Tax=Eragrostis curvula TaxID=38414 RepID=A0A5J9V7V4_9POAL|nr:hypothetical protein EJB05_23742 [Eragrostis curvula]